MGRKRKLQHFKENKSFSHFFQPTYDELIKGFELKGNWKLDFFKNDNPIILELGCGKGEYAVGLAKKYSNKNFIGIDRKGARMWRGAKTSFEEKMTNVAFVRIRVELIARIFSQDEVDEIWITFPDPQAKDKNEKRRLTSRRFLDIYSKFLAPGGKIHLKSDSGLLYKYTRGIIFENKYREIYHTDDLYKSSWEGDAVAFRTHYEKGFLDQGIPIKYLQFTIEKQ